MNYDINKALAELEKSLKDIDSAREQVEKTVNAYAELRGKVESYTNSFKAITTSVKNLIETAKTQNEAAFAKADASLHKIEESCGSVNKTFEESCESAVKKFNEKTVKNAAAVDKHIENLKKEIDNLQEIQNAFTDAIQKTDALKTELEGIAYNIHKSQSEQDLMLKTIEQSIEHCKTDIGKSENAIKEDLKNLLSFVAGKTDQLESKIQSSGTEIGEQLTNSHKDIKDTFAKLRIQIVNANSKLDKHLDLHDKYMDELGKSISNNQSEIQTNRKIAYGVIVLVIIDIILRFV